MTDSERATEIAEYLRMGPGYEDVRVRVLRHLAEVRERCANIAEAHIHSFDETAAETADVIATEIRKSGPCRQ